MKCCDLLLFSYLCKVLDNPILFWFKFDRLWFAFIFVSLQSLRQPNQRCRLLVWRCDLLLFSYLCKVLDNPIWERERRKSLWFAFIFVSLQSLRQRVENKSLARLGCDLLLFSYLCKVLDNHNHLQSLTTRVVICFYFRIFAKS